MNARGIDEWDLSPDQARQVAKRANDRYERDANAGETEFPRGWSDVSDHVHEDFMFSDDEMTWIVYVIDEAFRAGKATN